PLSLCGRSRKGVRPREESISFSWVRPSCRKRTSQILPKSLCLINGNPLRLQNAVRSQGENQFCLRLVVSLGKLSFFIFSVGVSETLNRPKTDKGNKGTSLRCLQMSTPIPPRAPGSAPTPA